MNNVYIVIDSDQEEFNIHGVFSTKKKAKEYIDAVNSMTQTNELYKILFDEIIEIKLNELCELTNRIKAGYKPYVVTTTKDNDLRINMYYFHRFCESCEIIQPEKSIYGENISYLACRVWAKSEQHAKEIVNEKRVQLISNGEWDERGIN